MNAVTRTYQTVPKISPTTSHSTTARITKNSEILAADMVIRGHSLHLMIDKTTADRYEIIVECGYVFHGYLLYQELN